MSQFFTLRKVAGGKAQLALYAVILIAASGTLFLQSQSHAQTEPTSNPTRIEVDENNHVIRFYIKGEPAAMLDEHGLHVINAIDYGTTIADKGSEKITDKIKASEDQAEGAQ